jgi:hypothetical protein
VSSLGPLEQGGIPLALVVVAKNDADELGDESQANQDAGRSWTVLQRATLRVESGVVNVGYVFTPPVGLQMADFSQLLLPPPSPVRSPEQSTPGSIWSSHTTTRLKGVEPQTTGTTTIARQFTGMGGGDPLIRQMTGNRSVSPIKQLGTPTTRFPRPKSVIGMRGEGRGMQLVRQMTGGSSIEI